MPIARVNGVGLMYKLHGGNGPPLVLVRGSWSSRIGWLPVLPHLTSSFQVLTYDRRGHTDSERPPGQGSVHEAVADLAALVEYLDLGPVHLVGLSFGACISLRLTAVRPDLVRTLNVHEPPLAGLLALDPATRPLAVWFGTLTVEVVRRVQAGDVGGGAQAFFDGLMPGSWALTSPEMKARRAFNAPTFVDERQDPDEYTVDPALLRRIRCRTLLTEGGQSLPFFRRIVDAVAQAIPGASRHTLPEVGHTPQATHPQLYAETITNFAAG